MLRAWASGRYRVIPWKTMALAGVLFLYVFSPIDIIPDYIPFVGYIDDLVLLSFLVRSVGRDIALFADWEKQASSGA